MDFDVLSEVMVKKIYNSSSVCSVFPVKLDGLSFIGDINDIIVGVPMRIGMPNIKDVCYLIFNVIPNSQFIMAIDVPYIDRYVWDHNVPWLTIGDTLRHKMVSIFLHFSGFDITKGVQNVEGGLFFGGIFVSSAVCVTIDAACRLVASFNDVQCNNVYVIEDFPIVEINERVADVVIKDSSHMFEGSVISEGATVTVVDGVNRSMGFDIKRVLGDVKEVDSIPDRYLPVCTTIDKTTFVPESVCCYSPVDKQTDGAVFDDRSDTYYALPYTYSKTCPIQQSKNFSSFGCVSSYRNSASSPINLICYDTFRRNYFHIDFCLLSDGLRVFEWTPDLWPILSGCVITSFQNGFHVFCNHPVFGKGGFFFPYRLNKFSIILWVIRFFILGDSKKLIHYQKGKFRNLGVVSMIQRLLLDGKCDLVYNVIKQRTRLNCNVVSYSYFSSCYVNYVRQKHEYKKYGVWDIIWAPYPDGTLCVSGRGSRVSFTTVSNYIYRIVEQCSMLKVMSVNLSYTFIWQSY